MEAKGEVQGEEEPPKPKEDEELRRRLREAFNLDNYTAQLEEEAEPFYLVCDFINHYLRERGISWHGRPQLPPPNEVRFIMRMAADQFAIENEGELDKMLSGLDLSPEASYVGFNALVQGLFMGQTMTWGRVVAIFAFCARAAYHCCQIERGTVVRRLADWLVILLRDESTLNMQACIENRLCRLLTTQHRQ